MKSYSWSYKLLHWLMAVLFILMFFAFIGFDPAMSQQQRIEMLLGHSSIGSIIVILLLFRLTKRFVLKHTRPEPEQHKGRAKLAKLSHGALYILMVLVPVTGYLTANFHKLPVAVFGQFVINNNPDSAMFLVFRNVHSIAIISLIVLLCVHIGAALFHKLVLKDHTMYKMRPWFSRK